MKSGKLDTSFPNKAKGSCGLWVGELCCVCVWVCVQDGVDGSMATTHNPLLKQGKVEPMLLGARCHDFVEGTISKSLQ